MISVSTIIEAKQGAEKFVMHTDFFYYTTEVNQIR